MIFTLYLCHGAFDKRMFFPSNAILWSKECPDFTLKQEEYATLPEKKKKHFELNWHLFCHGPLKAGFHAYCTFWNLYCKQTISKLVKLTNSQFTLQASDVPPTNPSHHQPSNQPWASLLAVLGVSGRAPAAWRNMELGMGEWEGELGLWKGDMETATYPSGPSTIPCVSINRLTAITITLEGP